MKKVLEISILVLLISILSTSCKDKNTADDNETPVAATGKISLAIHAKWQGAPYSNTAVVEDAYGNQLRIDNFTSYISTLSLLKSDGTSLLLKDYSLFNFAQENTVEFTVPKGDYTGIRFLIGVPADVNMNTDPAQYPNNHVLSVAGSQGMFWNWNTGYIFTKLEGKADTTGTNQPLLYSFSYHTGNDHYTQNVNLMKDITIAGGATANVQLLLHIEKIFSPDTGAGINLAVISGFHSPGPAMGAFVNNFTHAFEIE